MRYFKIFGLLSSFSAIEKKEFEQFIQSPYFAPSRDYIPVLKAVLEFSNDSIDISNISNEDFFKKIFPGSKYNNKTLRNRLTELTVLAKKYLIQKSLERDANLHDLLLLKKLKDNKLYELFHKEYERINKSSDQRDRKSHSIAEAKLLNIFVSLEKNNFEKIFENYADYADYYISMFFETYFEIMLEFESEKQYKIDNSNNIGFELIKNLRIERFIKSLEEKDKDRFLKIIIFYYLYESYTDFSDEVSYKKFSDVFYKNLDNLSGKLKEDIFGYMITRYLYMVNSGKPEYLKEIFKIYNLKLELGLFSELKAVRYPAAAFRDYIVVGLRLKKYKWVKDFINKYSSELPAEIRDTEEVMAYARLYLFKKDYVSALKTITGLKSTNYLYTLDASRIKMRIFYETADFEEGFLEIDRIKHYLKNNRKKIAATVRNYSKDFADNYNALLKLRLNPNNKEIDFFNDRIQKNTSYVLRDWLLQKIRELKNN
jgi:hypothetical protein